jgi:polysaccharide export outer membrane protein
MKRKYLTIHTYYTVILICFITFLNSCAPVQKVVYFENLQRDTTFRTLVNDSLELKIRKNDLLSINIVSPDPISTPLFNGAQNIFSSSAGSPSTGTPGSGGSSNGYLVDNQGNIVMYKLGAIHVEGMTRTELKELLQRDLAPYLKDAVITIRFLNNHITMLGELTRPGVLSMPTEQISLLDAIAQSGDLTITGRRDNIMVIRETTEGKQFKRLNLNDNSIFHSPFYYLKPNDVVYVEPTELKIKNTAQTQQTISYALAAVTFLVTILNLLLK